MCDELNRKQWDPVIGGEQAVPDMPSPGSVMGGMGVMGAANASGQSSLLRELHHRRDRHQRDLDNVARLIEMATTNPALLDSIEFQDRLNRMR